MNMNSKTQLEEKPAKRLSVRALVIIDVLATCFSLGVFALFFFDLLGINPQPEPIPVQQLAASVAEVTPAPTAALPESPSPSPIPTAPEESASDFPTELSSVQTAEPSSEPEPEPTPADDWKFASLTTDEPVFTDSGYSSRDICIKISSYDTGEGVIDSPYTVADIYVRDIRCLQSYFAGGKYIPTGHGEEILTLMEESGAIVAANGDYYSMQMGSGVLRNGVLYRYPKADFDVFVLYDDGSVTIYPKRSIRTEQDWAKAFENAWQVWSFGPSLLDENGKQYEDLRASLFPVVANRNPRTGIGYYEPGHYCLVVVDGRDGDSAPGASIEEFASVFESLGCKQAYNLDGGGTSRMAFDGEIITEPSQDRVLPDIVLVAEYEGSGAWKEAQNAEEVS
jgi:hypothetical protein